MRQSPGYLRFCLICACVLFMGLPFPLSARNRPDSISVVLAPEFKKEWPYGILFGSHHQLLWTTPITLQLLSLSSPAGGLIPCREFVTPDNRFLVLATPAGDTVLFTPLRERFADDQADPRDRRLIPTHPSSALVADDLAGSVGLLRAHPKLVWLADDSLLGTYRSTYGGSAGFLAAIDDGVKGASVLLQDSEKLFSSLDADSRNTVDARAFLLSRFIDLLTGDWHRSIWKWWWLASPREGCTWYTPVSSMRRHALLKLSSFPSMLHSALSPGFVNFTGDITDVSRAMTAGAALDVRILAGTDRPTWERVTGEFMGAVSDSAIDAALLRLPLQHREIEADTIAALLRSRRQSFVSVSNRYYLALAAYAEIELSNVAERVTIDRLEDGRVEVVARQSGSGQARVFGRTFLPDETKEVRVHCLGGNDTVIVRGSTAGNIIVRVDGGPGDDVLRDESVVRTVDTGFLGLFSSPTVMTFFYDHEGSNEITGGAATDIDTSPESEFVPRGKFF
jgi:hypothetical protein